MTITTDHGAIYTGDKRTIFTSIKYEIRRCWVKCYLTRVNSKTWTVQIGSKDFVRHGPAISNLEMMINVRFQIVYSYSVKLLAKSGSIACNQATRFGKRITKEFLW